MMPKRNSIYIDNSTKSTGAGVLGLLGVAFVVLKLTGYIDWSWWWVTAPFWGPFALFLAVFAALGLVTVLIATGVAVHEWATKRRKKRLEEHSDR